MFLAGLEPATFRVLGGRDNHYTTETYMKILYLFTYLKISIQINCWIPLWNRYSTNMPDLYCDFF